MKFSSNDYLGLARSRELHDLIASHISDHGLYSNGATGSRLLTGNTAYTEEVEHYLASIFQTENVLIFNSGYTANLAVLSTLPQKNDTIIYDELAHACIKDGARLSLAHRYSFRHNDLEDLERKMKKASGTIYVVVESIYSMDGDFCPLEELITLSERYGALVIVDEAHSTGIFGSNGSGLVAAKGLDRRIAVRIFTFGKAMGVHGACVAASSTFIDYLINFSRPFIYTTALPPHSIASIHCSFKYLSYNSELQNQLLANIQAYQEVASAKGIQANKSAIQVLSCNGNNEAKSRAALLQNHGFDVRAILSPTVPVGKERLRICLHAFNEVEEIGGLIACF